MSVKIPGKLRCVTPLSPIGGHGDLEIKVGEVYPAVLETLSFDGKRSVSVVKLGQGSTFCFIDPSQLSEHFVNLE